MCTVLKDSYSSNKKTVPHGILVAHERLRHQREGRRVVHAVELGAQTREQILERHAHQTGAFVVERLVLAHPPPPVRRDEARAVHCSLRALPAHLIVPLGALLLLRVGHCAAHAREPTPAQRDRHAPQANARRSHRPLVTIQFKCPLHFSTNE